MNCDQAQHEMLTSDDLTGASFSGELSAHLQDCGACGRLLSQLRRLEETAARELPIPDTSDARSAFLVSLAPAISPHATAPRARFRRNSIHWRTMAAAAVVLLAIGTAVWVLMSGGTDRALADDVTVDRLLEWNLKIADAESPDARASIFATQVTALKSQVDHAALPVDQQQLANKLLENGSWLSAHADPLAGAERFDEVANLVLDQLHSAAAQDHPKAAARLSRQYGRLAMKGLGPQLKAAKSARLDKPDRKKRYDRLMTSNQQLNQRLLQLLEASPNATRKEIRRQLGNLQSLHPPADATQP